MQKLPELFANNRAWAEGEADGFDASTARVRPNDSTGMWRLAMHQGWLERAIGGRCD